MEKDGILSPVTDIQATYHLPTHYGETVRVKTWVAHYDGVRVKYRYEITNKAGQLCVSGISTHVCVRRHTFRPISMRKHLPDWHEVYEKIKAQ